MQVIIRAVGIDTVSGIVDPVGLDLIKVAEAARVLVVTEREVLQLVTDGLLTQYRRGREVLVDRAEVEGLGG